MFGQNHLGDVGHKGQTQAASMPDTAEVCGCNGVCKGTIVKAIKEKGLFSLDDVRKHTKASSRPADHAPVSSNRSSPRASAAPTACQLHAKAMCGCTDMNARRRPQGDPRPQHLIDIPTGDARTWSGARRMAARRAVPALNYYVQSSWPHEAKDDPQSRFINERAHANIQKDGTYSVVPRMWGGLTTPNELRAIADAAEKYRCRP
jgi:nitrite reductase (NADH) large subunit